MVVYALFVAVSMWFAMVIGKMAHQRYVCKDCGKSFVIATNSIVSGTRKDLSVWEQYIDCMMNGLSIRKTCCCLWIHRKHRIPLETQDFGMHFRIWQTMLPLTALLRLTKLFSPSRTRAIIARVRHLLCHARLISVVILHISELVPRKGMCSLCG